MAQALLGASLSRSGHSGLALPARSQRRLHATQGPPGSTSAVAAADGGTARDFSVLTSDELKRTLAQRGLTVDGGRQEQESRLADFLAQPPAFPDAIYRPAACHVRVVGGRLFGSLAVLRSHIQLLMELLQGEVVEEGHPDFAFLTALLGMHPRFHEKVAHPPVLRFRVCTEVQHDQPPIRFFEYQDGRRQWEDFSYRKCIGFKASHNTSLTLRDAMRWEVREQVQAFRLASATVGPNGRDEYRCDGCGWRAFDSRRLRLEHVEPSFGKLIKDFTAAAGREPPPVDGKVPGSTRGCFTDEEWAAAWRRYHRKHARHLQLLCHDCCKNRKAAAAEGDRPAQAAAAAAEGAVQAAAAEGWP